MLLEHTLALQAARKQALTEPDGETPLVTFRRGCSKKGSITSVLGGCGAFETLPPRVTKMTGRRCEHSPTGCARARCNRP